MRPRGRPLQHPSGSWHSGKDVLSRLNSWFRHAVTCIVQFLRVRIRCADKCAGSPWHDLEDLPLVSRHLTRLEIHGVQLGSSLLDFSSCPALKHLVLEWCDLSMLAEKISFQSLKYLTLTGPLFNRDFRIHIYAPSLLSLCLDNFGGRTPVIGSIPSLEEALVRITGHCEDYCTLWWGEYCDCDFCNSSDNISGGSNNCVLLKGLSEAKNLTLVSELPMVYIINHLLHLLYIIWHPHYFPFIANITVIDKTLIDAVADLESLSRVRIKCIGVLCHTDSTHMHRKSH